MSNKVYTCIYTLLILFGNLLSPAYASSTCLWYDTHTKKPVIYSCDSKGTLTKPRYIIWTRCEDTSCDSMLDLIKSKQNIQ